MGNALKTIKVGNRKKFAGKIPKTDENDAWMAGKWGEKWNSLLPQVEFNGQLPFPKVNTESSQKYSRQSMMVSNTSAQGPPSVRKGNWFDKYYHPSHR